jgi:hypothetical protein
MFLARRWVGGVVSSCLSCRRARVGCSVHETGSRRMQAHVLVSGHMEEDGRLFSEPERGNPAGWLFVDVAGRAGAE